jgi:uncharacterized protein
MNTATNGSPNAGLGTDTSARPFGEQDEAGTIAAELGVAPRQVAAAIALLDDGNTLPFIARYRKEATEGLDDGQLRQLAERLDALRALAARRATILTSIAEQGQLTDALQRAIAAATTRSALEDLYLPYRPKRRTRAMMAREKGLGPLADMILAQPRVGRLREELARPFISRQVPTAEEAYAGARDIVAEAVADHAAIRGRLREKGLVWGQLSARPIPGASDPRGVFDAYRDFSQRLGRLQPHQVLALDRAEAEKVLRLSLAIPERDWRSIVADHFRPDPRSVLADDLAAAIDDGVDRLLLPAIERDLRSQLTAQAQAHAITVFARNLRALLNQPPLADRNLVGIDPGYRSGCQVAVVDPTGRVLATSTLQLAIPGRGQEEARHSLAELVERHQVRLIAIGNGTAGRDVEQQVARLTRERQDLRYLVVSEAGASVYSASALASAELPDLDVTLRGAVSIARRVLDPLAELVKIEPRAIGVGLYQHDVDQKALVRSLDGVVEDTVNAVGVDLNTASPALLGHVAGIGPKLAGAIVTHRERAGAFGTRRDLLAVGGLGPRAFQQCAGFLRVRGGAEALDASAIHPESYPAARRLLRLAGLEPEDLAGQRASEGASRRREAVQALLERLGEGALAAQLGVGIPTLRDIIAQLERPGRDPRADVPPPLLRSDILSMDDLLPGMQLAGTVRNVVDFGAFVDIGVKEDGLLHRSVLPPGTRLEPGQVLQVEVQRVEADRGRIALGWVDGHAAG